MKRDILFDDVLADVPEEYDNEIEYEAKNAFNALSRLSDLIGSNFFDEAAEPLFVLLDSARNISRLR